MRLFQPDRFADFGASRFRPLEWTAPTIRLRPRPSSELKAAVRDECPRRPGVYGMLDRTGHLIYVGKAKSLRTRLLSYFRENSRDHKAGRIIGAARSILWEETTSEFAALLRELELIQRHLPMFNVQGKPGQQRSRYVCIGRAPVPYAYTATRLTGKEVACYGPLVGASRIEEAVRRLNQTFGLRDCSGRISLGFADQTELFETERSPKCLRYELGSCLGPCVRACTAATYQKAVAATRRFLEGRNRVPLVALEQEMTLAANAFQFEKAAAIRDKLADLMWLVERLTWVQHARDQHSFIFPHGDAAGRTLWYIVHRGQVRSVTFQPRTRDEGTQVASLIRDCFSRSEPMGQPLPAGQIDSVLLVASWFRKHEDDRPTLLTQEQAMALCTGLPINHLSTAIALNEMLTVPVIVNRS